MFFIIFIFILIFQIFSADTSRLDEEPAETVSGQQAPRNRDRARVAGQSRGGGG
jgi:hypothetical protein